MNQEQDLYFMRMAIELSRENVRNGGSPFGAVVVKDGKVIATGANSVVPDHDPTAHAEINAIRIAGKNRGTFNLEGCVIYSSCEPCPMCLSAIYWARIDKLYWANSRKDAQKIGFSDSFIYDQIPLPIDQRILPSEVILSDEAITVFKQWQEEENKTLY